MAQIASIASGHYVLNLDLISQGTTSLGFTLSLTQSSGWPLYVGTRSCNINGIDGTSPSISGGAGTTTTLMTATVTGLSPGTTYSISGHYAIQTTIQSTYYDSMSGSASFTTAQTAPTGVSINPVATDSTTINLNRAWTNATYCQYNINDWGWISEGSTYSNGVKCDGNTVSNLSHNTEYKCIVKFGNSGGETQSNTAYATTSGDIPVINTLGVSIGRDSATFTLSDVTYDTNASYKKINIDYGLYVTSTYANSAVIDNTITGLEPNTSYYYNVSVTDNFDRISDTTYGTFKTSCNVPSNLVLTFPSITSDSIEVKLSGDGDSNAPITKFILYYKKSGDEDFSSLDLNASTSQTFSELSVDTDYVYYFEAYNDGGSSTSSVETVSTNLINPSISKFEVSNLLPFSCTLNTTASITAERVLNYAFSSDNGSTWTSYQSLSSYNLTGLNEETSYIVEVKVKASHTGSTSEDTYAISSMTIKTLADQAKARKKVNGQWKQGKVYKKENGQWVKAKKIYRKKNGKWEIGINN